VCLASKYANLTSLQTLPMVTVSHTDTFGTDTASVTLTNSSASLAFLIRARVTNLGQDVLPAFWSDNYVSLLPGETRILTATFEPGGLPSGSIAQIDGFNVNPN
jgi:exo-1,4-beta-D-glucosaminidase